MIFGISASQCAPPTTVSRVRSGTRARSTVQTSRRNSKVTRISRPCNSRTMVVIRASLSPMVRDPARRPRMAPVAVAAAGQRIRRVHDAVEDQDARALGDEGVTPVARRPGGNAVVLVAGAPGVVPILQLALPVQHGGQEGLLVAVL